MEAFQWLLFGRIIQHTGDDNDKGISQISIPKC